MANMAEDKHSGIQFETGRNRVNILAMIGSAIGGTLTLNEILDQALDVTLASLDMDAGEIFLFDAVRGEVSKVRHRGQVPEAFAERTCFVVGEGIPGCVVQSMEAIIIPDLASDCRFLRPQVVEAGFRTFAAIPLRAKGKMVGCFTIAGRRAYILTESDLDLLNAVGATIGLAVANGHLYEDLWLATKQLEAKIEELGRTQAALVEAERLRAMGQLAAGIAHDFNNALTTILGQSQLMQLSLKHGTLSTDQLAAYLRRQERAALDAAETVRRIRVATRPKGAEPLVAVAINETIEEVVEVTRSRWQNEPHVRGVGITLRTDLATVPEVSGRGAELREALINLLFNAIDALPNGGAITITTKMVASSELHISTPQPETANVSDMVEIAVSDTGIGMPEAVRARLFEPFFTTKGIKGSGLGLSMVHGIVSRHGGTIEVISVAGVGTTVTIRLPVASAPVAPIQEPVTLAALPSSLRILVIDDVPPVAETLALMLCILGYEAEAIVRGEDGLARLEQGYFDLVITDLSMPGMSGYDVAAAVKKRYPELPVILMTGWMDVETNDKLAAGIIDLVLPKPLTGEQVTQAIAQVWAGREITRPSSNGYGCENAAFSRQNT